MKKSDCSHTRFPDGGNNRASETAARWSEIHPDQSRAHVGALVGSSILTRSHSTVGASEIGSRIKRQARSGSDQEIAGRIVRSGQSAAAGFAIVVGGRWRAAPFAAGG
jgi:hypothetical protein